MELSLAKTKDSKPIARAGSQIVYVKDSDKPYSERVKILKLEPRLKFEVIPYIQDDQRTAVFASGPSGSGKTTSCVNYIKELRKMPKFKDYPIYFFTNNKSEEPAFKGLKNLYGVDIESPLTLHLKHDEFKNSIVLFDDWNSVADKELKKFLESLVKQLLENSRKNNVQILVVNHLTQNYNETRLIIHECECYFLYPGFNMNSVLKFLKSYLNLDQSQLDMIRDLNTRSIFVRKSVPRYIISDDQIILI